MQLGVKNKILQVISSIPLYRQTNLPAQAIEEVKDL